MISQRWMAGGLAVVALAVIGSVTRNDTPTAAVAAEAPATNASSHLPGGTAGGARTYVTLTMPPTADLPTPLPTVPATPAPTDPATATPTAGDTTAYRRVVISDVPAVGTALTAERAPLHRRGFRGLSRSRRQTEGCSADVPHRPLGRHRPVGLGAGRPSTPSRARAPGQRLPPPDSGHRRPELGRDHLRNVAGHAGRRAHLSRNRQLPVMSPH